MTGTEAKKMRESFGLSQSDAARNLGYANRFAISRIEGYEEVPEMYRKALENLCELMQLMTEKIDFLIEYKSFQFESSELIFARKNRIVRRIYSNNHLQIINFANKINRNVITRKEKLYKYEIIVF